MLKTLFNRKEANELCSKFGSDVFMAGEINSQLDFDEYYKVVVSFLTKKTKVVKMPQPWQDSTSIHIQLAKSFTYVTLNTFLPYTLTCFSLQGFDQ